MLRLVYHLPINKFVINTSNITPGSVSTSVTLISFLVCFETQECVKYIYDFDRPSFIQKLLDCDSGNDNSNESDNNFNDVD